MRVVDRWLSCRGRGVTGPPTARIPGGNAAGLAASATVMLLAPGLAASAATAREAEASIGTWSLVTATRGIVDTGGTIDMSVLTLVRETHR